MPQFYNSYCSYTFILGGEDTISQYNPKIFKKKKKKKPSKSTSNYCFNIIYSLSLCEHNNAQYESSSWKKEYEYIFVILVLMVRESQFEIIYEDIKDGGRNI
jgi:hypothetical protein